MNKRYLKSLSSYLVFNSAVWVFLSTMMGGMTVSSFFMSTLLAIIIHRFFLYPRGA
jgi:hypothetical protein